jgi:hypothetical protein
MAILTQKEKKIVFVCREREQELKKNKEEELKEETRIILQYEKT